ncbi:MAG: DUF5060 domain-containing protein [Rhodothermales bacterium]
MTVTGYSVASVPYAIRRQALRRYAAFALVCMAPFFVLSARCRPVPSRQGVQILGEKRLWHPITLQMDGPAASEVDAYNPFLNYRLDVTFTHNGTSYVVPGYFAADGNAAETSAIAGSVWRAHFVPDETGVWTYEISFVEGPDIAIADDASGGAPTAFHGLTGSFTVTDTDKEGRDFRAVGMPRYADTRYMRLDNGDWFLENGSGSPENLLADPEIDGTYNFAGDHLKTYSAHLQDWQAGDPTWKGSKGKGIIGAMNYLAGKGINSQFFITMNVEGDGKDVWPWTAYTERYRFDVSKLDQWEIIFSHMSEKGILLHVVLQELGNEFLLDGGELGPQRRLYYREIIARFAHHPLKWNLGEEHKIEGIGNTDAQRQAYVAYISATDPYKHVITMHSQSGTTFYIAIYGPLLGNEAFSGMSLQVHGGEFDVAGDKTYNFIKDWIGRSTDAGHPWIVTLDECCGWNSGVEPDTSNMDAVRHSEMWGSLMAGGAGYDWYLGFTTEQKRDLNLQDFRIYDFLWTQSTHAHTFFTTFVPFQELKAQTGLTPDYQNRVLAIPGSLYVVYLPNGGTTTLDLGSTSKTYPIYWYNPRTGGNLQTGSKTNVSGPGVKTIGDPPEDPELDWVAVVGVPIRTDIPGTHLPVALTSFDAVADGGAVDLVWTTASELNNAGFEVQMQRDHTFETVDFVSGHGTSSDAHVYRFRTPQLAPGSHTFRLKQIDFDGAFAYSHTASARVDLTASYALSPASPNPFNPQTQFTLTVSRPQPVTIALYDLLGRRVATIFDGEMPAQEARLFRLDAGALPSGRYFIQAHGAYFSTSQLIVLQK